MAVSPLVLAMLGNGQSGQPGITDPNYLAAIPKLNLAQSMMQQGLDSSPASPWQALARVANAYVGNREFTKAAAGLGQIYTKQASDLSAALAPDDPRQKILKSGNPSLISEVIKSLPASLTQASEPFSLRPNEIRYGPGGSRIAGNSVPLSPEGKLNADINNLPPQAAGPTAQAGGGAPSGPGAPAAAPGAFDARAALVGALLKQGSDKGVMLGPNGATPVSGYGTAVGKNEADALNARTPAEAANAATVEAAKNPALIQRAGSVAQAEVAPHVQQAVGEAVGTAPFHPAGSTVVQTPNGPVVRPISEAELAAVRGNPTAAPPMPQGGAPQLPGVVAPRIPLATAPSIAPPMPPQPAPAPAGNAAATAGTPAPSIAGQPPMPPKPDIAPPPVQAAPGSAQAAPQIGAPYAEPQMVADRTKAFGEARGAYNAATLALNQTRQIKQVLSQIPNAGPATEQLGQLAAYAQQAGVPAETIKKYGLPSGATVQEAQKLSRDLLGEVLKTQFPGRITNTDITAWQNTVPNATALPDAANYLIDQVIMPKAQRDIGRFQAISDLPKTDPTLGGMDQRLLDYDKAHPLPVPTINAQGKVVSGPSAQDIVDELRKRGKIK